MEIVKTICPKCFKIFTVSEEIDRVKCNYCEYDYGLPKLSPNNEMNNSGYIRKLYADYL